MGFINKDQNTTSNFAPFEAGPQKLEIAVIEKRKTNAKDGSYLNLELVVAKGKQKGRKLWHTLNLDNPNADTVEIAKKEAMQMVVQIKGSPIDIKSEDHLIKILKGQIVEAQVKIKTDKDGKYPDKNAIAYFIMDEDQKGFSDDDDGPTTGKPPWETDDKPEKKKKKKKKEVETPDPEPEKKKKKKKSKE